MPDLAIHIKRIQEKLQQLIKQQHELQKENNRLKKELDKSSNQSAQYVQVIETLKQQVEVLKMNPGTWEEKDKKNFEKRINNYLKEIDKCIALLGE